MNLPEHHHHAGCDCYQKRPEPQPPACCGGHQAPVRGSSGSAAKWLAAGVGGSFLAVSLAVSLVAVAISAVALTICILVLRSIWQDIQKEK